jgi:hypothetical protein
MLSLERDPAAEELRGRHHRQPTEARRELLTRFRDEVRQGTYRPPVDAVAGQLAAFLIDTGLVDEDRRRARPD